MSSYCIKLTTFTILIALYATSSARLNPVAATSLEPGGTNFVVYDLGDYGLSMSADNFAKLDTQGGLKSVIGAYDLNPTLVKNQIDRMCSNGQRKIGFMLHHGRFAPYPNNTPLYNLSPDQAYPQNSSIIIINSTGGSLQPRHEQNLFNIIDYIAKEGCFNEIQFRFAPSWYSFIGSWGDPTDWSNPTTGWQEGVYLENFAFIKSVRNLIQNTLTQNQSNIKVYYDLAAETGGITYEYLVPDNDPIKNIKTTYYQVLTELYQKRLLTDYNQQFGINDTYGFSIALIPGRFARLMGVYDAINIHPAQHAIDIYDVQNTGVTPVLTALSTEIQQSGEVSTPIIVQETYFNDLQIYADLLSAKSQLGINIRTIMQWQTERAKTYRPNTTELSHFSTTSTAYSYLDRYLAGDLNGDDHVDISDFNLLISKFGNPYTVSDFSAIISNFGQ